MSPELGSPWLLRSKFEIQRSKPNVNAILILTLILHLTQVFVVVSISELLLMRLETWNKE